MSYFERRGLLKVTAVAAIAICLIFSTARAGQLYRMDNAVVEYENIDAGYAEAICRTASSASEICRGLGFDMPKTIKINVTCGSGQRVRLFNGGNDRIYLSIKSEKNLLKPADSGIHHVYGLCHEVGHLAMYRLIRQHSWMSSAAAEGWAHFMGSLIVDSVWLAHAADLWPDEHDYSVDGTERLNAQIQDGGKTPVAKGAGLWKELAELIKIKEVPAVFGAWSKAEIDPTDPGAALRTALLAVNDNPQLAQWWNKAEPAFIVKQPKSGFVARTAKSTELQGQPIELALDDGRQASKKSIAGSGHAVKYKVQGDSWYLSGVRIFGSRYGHTQAPRENFHVWLCDTDLNVIADFPQPYGKFKKGNPRWVNLATKPTNVPAEFIVCVGFNPTGTKGVFVGIDGKDADSSMTALPGKDGKAMDKGNWMIRLRLDQLKSANSLTLAK